MQEEAEIAAVAQVNGNAEVPAKPDESSTSAAAVAATEEAPGAVNGTQAAAETTNGTNGEATPSKKAKKEKKEKKEKVQEPKEPPKSLQEDPADWAKHHAGLANHKANYDLLSKITALVSSEAVEEGAEESKRAPLPGKQDSVTSSQFVAHFSDGQLASQVVKKLSIIAAVPSVEGEEELKKKENQIALLQAFADFAKTEGGVPEEKLPVLAEVQEGKKSAYPALFATLVTALANKGQVNAEQMAADAVKYAEENCFTGKARTVVSQISHSISNMKLSLNRKKSAGEAAHENGDAEKANGNANGVQSEEKVNGENGNGETSHAPNGNITGEEAKNEEGRAVAAN